MTKRSASLTSVVVAALIAAVLIGSQVIASAGPATPRLGQPGPVAGSASPSTGDDEGECADQTCGNPHSQAVHAWVRCRATQGNGNATCVKPTPPGRALRHAQDPDTAPGPASADGHGHGWGRAHAPGQLKDKHRATGQGDRDADDPTD